MKYLLLSFFTHILIVGCAVVNAENCKFKYWQVIPASSDCKVLHLPDFDFRSLPDKEEDPEHIQRFCDRYEVQTGSTKQEVSYCYTGEGDRDGPSFELDHQEYLADLSFEGCVNGQEAKGTVFAPGGWSNSPKDIERFWPVESLPRRLSCAR